MILKTMFQNFDIKTLNSDFSHDIEPIKPNCYEMFFVVFSSEACLILYFHLKYNITDTVR